MRRAEISLGGYLYSLVLGGTLEAESEIWGDVVDRVVLEKELEAQMHTFSLYGLSPKLWAAGDGNSISSWGLGCLGGVGICHSLVLSRPLLAWPGALHVVGKLVPQLWVCMVLTPAGVLVSTSDPGEELWPCFVGGP